MITYYFSKMHDDVQQIKRDRTRFRVPQFAFRRVLALNSLLTRCKFRRSWRIWLRRWSARLSVSTLTFTFNSNNVRFAQILEIFEEIFFSGPVKSKKHWCHKIFVCLDKKTSKCPWISLAKNNKVVIFWLSIFVQLSAFRGHGRN